MPGYERSNCWSGAGPNPGCRGGVVAGGRLTAGSGYGLSAIVRLGWLTLSSPTASGVATLVVADRLGKAIRTAPRDAMISLSVRRDRLDPAGNLAPVWQRERGRICL